MDHVDDDGDDCDDDTSTFANSQLLRSASTFSSDKGGEAEPGNTKVGDFTKKDKISSFPIYRTETGGFEQCRQYVVDWNLVLNGTKPLTQEVGDLKI